MILEMFLLTLIIVFIIDLTDFVEHVKKWIWELVMGKNVKFVKYSLKPFDCSLCLTHWILAFYILFTNNLTISNYFLVCVFSMLTPVFKDVMITIREALILLVAKINDVIFK